MRELRKYDKHGILNHEDWFFRVAVLDFIVSEMQRLVFWFKNCSYDDFDTIYRIMRKLNLLHLDVESIWDADRFDINSTNLFYVSDGDMQEFTKVDGMLTGNTLYQLFKNQVRLTFPSSSESGSSAQEANTVKDKALLQDQISEAETDRQRTVRQDIVVRYWGSETELTRAAYDKMTQNIDMLTENI